MSVDAETLSPPDFTGDFSQIFSYLNQVDDQAVIMQAIQADPHLLQLYQQQQGQFAQPNGTVHDFLGQHGPFESVDNAIEFELERMRTCDLAQPLANTGLTIDAEAENLGLIIADAILFVRALSHTSLDTLEAPAAESMRSELNDLVDDFIHRSADRLCVDNIDWIDTFVDYNDEWHDYWVTKVHDTTQPQPIEAPVWLQRRGLERPELLAELSAGAPQPETIDTLLHFSTQILADAERLGFDSETAREFRLMYIAHDEGLLAEWAMAYCMDVFSCTSQFVGTRDLADRQALQKHLAQKAPDARFTMLFGKYLEAAQIRASATGFDIPLDI